VFQDQGKKIAEQGYALCQNASCHSLFAQRIHRLSFRGRQLRYKGGEKNMEAKLKAKVDIGFGSEVHLDFGRTQAEMSFSKTGTTARKLKLKKGEKVEIIIRKLE